MAIGVLDRHIASVRAFNRFYTRQIGLLSDSLLDTSFTLTESRVLYELAHRDGLTASVLAQELGLDAGYLSRILKKFESRGLLTRKTPPSDARQSVLTITDAGGEAFLLLKQAACDEARKILGALDPTERARLVGSMDTISRLLGNRTELEEPYILRAPRCGDMGWVVHRHGVLYHEEYGWDATFEGMVSEIVSDFVKTHDPALERCWIAERHGEVAGSVFVVKVSDEVAKLRMLYVEPWARGLGLGAKLVDEVIKFARDRGYKTLTLWTNDILGSARRIYETVGFELIEEEHHHSFGKELVGQNWSLPLV
ncbi:MAG: MarR family transcriptional regulator [Rhizobiales bacterium]|nr:MarR family transcriptional regulator [Hyphomicrobiales bacterium]